MEPGEIITSKCKVLNLRGTWQYCIFCIGCKIELSDYGFYAIPE